MILYHGSQFIIESPEYGKGSRFNDYGLGFYCTRHVELAKEWACTREHGGYANKYEIDMQDLVVLDLGNGEYSILNWLALLLRNRRFDISTPIKARAKEYILSEFLPDHENADIITGYRADDSYFSFANDFLSNGLSLLQLNKAMYLGDLGEQIVLKSPKAFSRIVFREYELAERDQYFAKRKKRDADARACYRREVSVGGAEDDIYLIDIIRQGWRNNDARLQRILP